MGLCRKWKVIISYDALKHNCFKTQFVKIKKKSICKILYKYSCRFSILSLFLSFSHSESRSLSLSIWVFEWVQLRAAFLVLKNLSIFFLRGEICYIIAPTHITLSLFIKQPRLITFCSKKNSNFIRENEMVKGYLWEDICYPSNKDCLCP